MFPWISLWSAAWKQFSRRIIKKHSCVSIVATHTWYIKDQFLAYLITLFQPYSIERDKIIMNGEKVRMWKEAVIVLF